MHSCLEGGFQVRTEHVDGLSREAVHKVDAYVCYAGFTAYPDCFKGLGCGVAPMQETEEFFIEGLHSHTDAVDTQGTQSGYIRRCDVIGITLYGEFLETGETKGGAYSTDDIPYMLRRKARRGSSAEIDGFDSFSIKVVLTELEFTTNGLNITCGFLLTHSREEAAVYTAFGAERYMYVYTGQCQIIELMTFITSSPMALAASIVEASE